jgi:hypothetical protein
MGTPLLIGLPEREALTQLRGLAAEHPVDMTHLLKRLKDPAQKAEHMAQMTRQSVAIPMDYLVTFSIELGHPCGTCRHMSMSVGKVGRVPNPQAVWMIAEILGFTGDLNECMTWQEELQGHGMAINVVQPITAEGGHA